MPGGVQIQQAGATCTLAINAYMTDSEEWGFFTASHCTPNFGIVDIYDPIYQNATGAGNIIGWELVDPELMDPGSGSCPGAVEDGCRYTDASFFVYENNSLPDSQTIARTTSSSGSYTISSTHPRFRVSGVSVDFAYEGMDVYKIGRTTGWTAGEVIHTCEDFYNGILTFCAVVTDYDSDGGDSGAPVFTWDGSSAYVEVVGIHFARAGTDGFYTPWSLIQIEIEGELTETLDFSY